jgi:hypothetical protein
LYHLQHRINRLEDYHRQIHAAAQPRS